METLSPIDKFSGKNSDSRNGQQNTYTFAVDVDFALEEGDKLEFTLPDQIKPPENSILLNCQPTEGLNDISCFVND